MSNFNNGGKTANTNGGKTAKNTNDKTLADFVANLTYATKRNGGKNGDGKTATMCANPKTPRLYLPPRYYASGYRSGLVGLDDKQNLFVVLTKQKHANAYTALHATQNFITVLGTTADYLRTTSYTYTITTEQNTPTSVILTLQPNGDTYKPNKR